MSLIHWATWSLLPLPLCPFLRDEDILCSFDEETQGPKEGGTHPVGRQFDVIPQVNHPVFFLASGGIAGYDISHQVFFLAVRLIIQRTIAITLI